MAKRIKAPERLQQCDTCAIGTWNTAFDNLDLEGKPITKRCPNYFEGKIGIVRGQKACNKYTQNGNNSNKNQS